MSTGTPSADAQPVRAPRTRTARSTSVSGRSKNGLISSWSRWLRNSARVARIFVGGEEEGEVAVADEVAKVEGVDEACMTLDERL